MFLRDVGYRELKIGDEVMCLDGIIRVIAHTQIATLVDGQWIEYLVFTDGSKLLPFSLMPLGPTPPDLRFAVNASDHMVPEIVRYQPDGAQVLVAITRERP